MRYKRILSLVLAAVLCAALSAPALASQEPEQDSQETLEEPAEETTETPILQEAAEPAEDGASETSEDEEAPITELEESFTLTLDGNSLEAALDNDEMFALYLDGQMYDTAVSHLDYGAQKFSGKDLTLYRCIKSQLEAIAAGERSSTVLTIPGSYTAHISGTEDEIYAAVDAFSNKLLKVLLLDCPAELYWFDKECGVQCGYTMGACTVDNKTTLIVTSLTLTFAVAGDYALNGASFTVDSAKITSALTAIDRAKALAADIRSTYATDYARLQAIRDWICDSTSYNISAAAGGVSYGDPWQMIYVFDQDDTTLVVCEGYAKATQYLCDLTLTKAQCYTVTGTMDGGAHMWNIVTIDGANYLLDLTSCDSGDNSDLRDWFFLVGADSGSVTKGYGVYGSLPEGYTPTSISYVYDSDTLAYYGTDVLTLADSAYVPSTQTEPEPGDVNGDNRRNLDDVTALFQYVTSGGGYDAYYDINGDSVVDLKDVTRLLQYISGQITTL